MSEIVGFDFGKDEIKLTLGEDLGIISLDRVSLHFPDPWWKKRHMKRAVFTPRTLEEIVRLLGPGGEIFVQTDVFPRAVSILRILTDQQDIENSAIDGGLLEKPVDDCPSNREQACMKAGLPVFRMLFRKKSQ